MSKNTLCKDCISNNNGWCKKRKTNQGLKELSECEFKEKESDNKILTEEKIDMINRYVARVEALLIRLDEVIPLAMDDEEYRNDCLEDDLKYIQKRVKIVRETKEELKEAFKEKTI